MNPKGSFNLVVRHVNKSPDTALTSNVLYWGDTHVTETRINSKMNIVTVIFLRGVRETLLLYVGGLRVSTSSASSRSARSVARWIIAHIPVRSQVRLAQPTQEKQDSQLGQLLSQYLGAAQQVQYDTDWTKHHHSRSLGNGSVAAALRSGGNTATRHNEQERTGTQSY